MALSKSNQTAVLAAEKAGGGTATQAKSVIKDANAVTNMSQVHVPTATSVVTPSAPITPAGGPTNAPAPNLGAGINTTTQAPTRQGVVAPVVQTGPKVTVGDTSKMGTLYTVDLGGGKTWQGRAASQDAAVQRASDAYGGASFQSSYDPEQEQGLQNTATKGPVNSTTEDGIDYAAEDRAALEKAQANYQAQATQVQDTIKRIQNGAIPLSQDQQTQINGLSSQFEALIGQQQLSNTNSQGVANVRGYQTGSGEYDNGFQLKTIGAIVTAGTNKVTDLMVKEASAVAQLTQSFKDNNIGAIKDAWGMYQDASKEKSDALQKTIDDTAAAIKAAQDKRQKIQDQVDSIAVEAAKNGASPDVIAKIGQTGSLNDALATAGDWIQEGTGDMADYLNYKRSASALGQSVQDYNTWLKAKEANEDRREANKAYSSAYAAASGRLAAEAKTGGTGSFKALTESQGKDLTYAQRADNAKAILDKLEPTITAMNPATYAAQVAAEGSSFLNQYVDPSVRQYRQAQRDYLTAVLRRESGAQIAPTEFATGELQYFGRPGDDPDTLTNKEQTRDTAVNSFKQNVPDYDARVAAMPSTGNTLNQAENLAKTTVASWASQSANNEQAYKTAVSLFPNATAMELKQQLGI